MEKSEIFHSKPLISINYCLIKHFIDNQNIYQPIFRRWFPICRREEFVQSLQQRLHTLQQIRSGRKNWGRLIPVYSLIDKFQSKCLYRNHHKNAERCEWACGYNLKKTCLLKSLVQQFYFPWFDWTKYQFKYLFCWQFMTNWVMFKNYFYMDYDMKGSERMWNIVNCKQNW